MHGIYAFRREHKLIYKKEVYLNNVEMGRMAVKRARAWKRRESALQAIVRYATAMVVLVIVWFIAVLILSI